MLSNPKNTLLYTFFHFKRRLFYNKIDLNLRQYITTYKLIMTTYTTGLTLKTERSITKDDIITMCKLLNSKDQYSNLCEFQPEGITEGGILFKFKDNLDNKWYKSVRLCVHQLCVNRGKSKGKWYWVNDNYLSEWTGNNDIIFDKNHKFTLFLKSLGGAPLFTLEELKIWEECFNQIGIIKVGKYPSKKSLITNDY